MLEGLFGSPLKWVPFFPIGACGHHDDHASHASPIPWLGCCGPPWGRFPSNSLHH